jgi:hypothetical protein
MKISESTNGFGQYDYLKAGVLLQMNAGKAIL